jgi:LysM repeat protein
MKSFKKFLTENIKAQLAALALTGSAMAAPPPAELPQIDRTLQGLASGEHRGKIKGSAFQYDPKLYIRAYGPDPSKPDSISTAYGPYQFVVSTIQDLAKRHPKRFAGSEEYVSKFIEQGNKMKQSPNDPKYGYGGSGDLSSEEYHKQYMDMSRAALSAMAKDIKVDLSKPLNSEDEQRLITRFRGRSPEPAYMKAYEKGVNIPKPEKESTSKEQSQEQTVKPKEQPKQQAAKPKEQQAQQQAAKPKEETELSSDYEVKPNDSLSKIAKQQGKTLDEIIKLNPQIKDPNKIQPGQKIKVK